MQRKVKVSEIARLCGYGFCGEDMEAASVRFYDCAREDSIAIVHSLSEIERTKARCVLSVPCIVNTEKTVIYTYDPIELAAVNIANIMIRQNAAPIKYQYVDHYYLGNRVIIGKDTVISPNVYIDDDVRIGEKCFISPNVHIGTGTLIKDNVTIGSGSVIGARSFYHYYDEALQAFDGIGNVVVESDVAIGNMTTIQRGTFSDTVIGKGSKLGNQVEIGHDVVIGRNTKIVSQTGIASKVSIGNEVLIYGQVGIANNIHIGDHATIYAKSLVTKNVRENQRVSGIYAQEHMEELKLQAKLRKQNQKQNR